MNDVYYLATMRYKQNHSVRLYVSYQKYLDDHPDNRPPAKCRQPLVSPAVGFSI